jgi:hypothetical protein
MMITIALPMAQIKKYLEKLQIFMILISYFFSESDSQ